MRKVSAAELVALGLMGLPGAGINAAGLPAVDLEEVVVTAQRAQLIGEVK